MTLKARISLALAKHEISTSTRRDELVAFESAMWAFNHLEYLDDKDILNEAKRRGLI